MTGIRDIARKAGVSPGTVSRVLNNDPTMSVSQSTRKRILAVVAETGYDLSSRKYAKKALPSLLVISTVAQEPANQDLYFTELQKGMAEEARRLHLGMNRLYHLADAPKKWQDFDKVGAIIVIGTVEDEELTRLRQLNENLIVVDKSSLPNIDADLVCSNFEEVTRQILQHFYQAGCRRIAYIGGYTQDMTESGHSGQSEAEKRLTSYRAFLQEHDLPEISFLGNWDETAGATLTKKLLESDWRPDALLFGSDHLAIGGYPLLTKHFVIGKELMVASFDDLPLAAKLQPSLTSVQIPSREMGKAAVRLAREKIYQERLASCVLTFPGTLIFRDSFRIK